MFFTKVATFFAHVCFWLGLVYLAFCIYLAIAMPDMAFNADGSSRYLATENTGEAINEAMVFLVCAVVVGVLAEVSSGVAKFASKIKGED